MERFKILKIEKQKENGENIDDLQYFIDGKNDGLVGYFLKSNDK